MQIEFSLGVFRTVNGLCGLSEDGHGIWGQADLAPVKSMSPSLGRSLNFVTLVSSLVYWSQKRTTPSQRGFAIGLPDALSPTLHTYFK